MPDPLKQLEEKLCRSVRDIIREFNNDVIGLEGYAEFSKTLRENQQLKEFLEVLPAVADDIRADPVQGLAVLDGLVSALHSVEVSSSSEPTRPRIRRGGPARIGRAVVTVSSICEEPNTGLVWVLYNDWSFRVPVEFCEAMPSEDLTVDQATAAGIILAKYLEDPDCVDWVTQEYGAGFVDDADHALAWLRTRAKEGSDAD